MKTVKFETKGNYKKFERFLTHSLHIKALVRPILDKYGRRGVELLREATPKDTGKTSESWSYEIERDDDGNWKIVWSNSNVVDDWANVAVLLQYGHATKNGGYVQGIDYINPALAKVFGDLADEAWKEVTSNGGKR